MGDQGGWGRRRNLSLSVSRFLCAPPAALKEPVRFSSGRFPERIPAVPFRGPLFLQPSSRRKLGPREALLFLRNWTKARQAPRAALGFSKPWWTLILGQKSEIRRSPFICDFIPFLSPPPSPPPFPHLPWPTSFPKRN